MFIAWANIFRFLKATQFKAIFCSNETNAIFCLISLY